MPTAANKTPVANLVHELFGKWKTGAINYRLYMGDDLKPGLEWGCSPTDVKVAGATPLILNHWNHLMGTFDGKVLRLYVNGSQAASASAAGSCRATRPIEVGGKSGLDATQYFTGRIDEAWPTTECLRPRTSASSTCIRMAGSRTARAATSL